MRHANAAHRPGRSTWPSGLRRLLHRGVVPAAVLLAICLGAAPAAAQTAADSTVTVVWTATGDDGNIGTASRYDLRYRTVAISGTDTLTWWNAATPVTGLPTPRAAGSTDSMRVRGLTPLTTYYFILKVGDEVPNWSGYSNVAVKTTTGDLTAPAAIANLTVTGATGASLSLRWTAPGDDGSAGTAASYDVRYSTSPITNANFASATAVTGEPAPAVAGTVQTMTVNGLSGSTTYYIAMKTTDDVGNVSALSNVPTGTTTDTVPPAAVRDLSYDPDGEPVDLRLAAETVTSEMADAR